jgi:hypothetical protein
LLEDNSTTPQNELRKRSLCAAVGRLWVQRITMRCKIFLDMCGLCRTPREIEIKNQTVQKNGKIETAQNRKIRDRKSQQFQAQRSCKIVWLRPPNLKAASPFQSLVYAAQVRAANESEHSLEGSSDVAVLLNEEIDLEATEPDGSPRV